jgi:hypothetical protein
MPVDEPGNHPLAFQANHVGTAGHLYRIGAPHRQDVTVRFEERGVVDDGSRAIEHTRTNVRIYSYAGLGAREKNRRDTPQQSIPGFHGRRSTTLRFLFGRLTTGAADRKLQYSLGASQFWHR